MTKIVRYIYKFVILAELTDEIVGIQTTFNYLLGGAVSPIEAR